MISIIAAIGKNRELGKNNALLWNIGQDLKRFKMLTTGHPIIMGRKTFESIGRALPNRTNIVITRQSDFRHEGIHVVQSLHDAIIYATSIDSDECFIIGGAQIYTQAIDIADRLYLTIINQTFEADVFFPDYGRFIHTLEEETHMIEGLSVTFKTLSP